MRNCVIVAAPHTSQWDFIIGVLARDVYRIRARYLIKHSFFKPGIAWFFRLTGGIAVDRSKNNDLTQQLKVMLKTNSHLKLAFAPEGTRKRVEKWKTGFYWVAVDTGLPIVPVAFDYSNRQVRRGDAIWPTGNWETDKLKLEAFFHPSMAKLPHAFNPVF